MLATNLAKLSGSRTLKRPNAVGKFGIQARKCFARKDFVEFTELGDESRIRKKTEKAEIKPGEDLP